MFMSATEFLKRDTAIDAVETIDETPSCYIPCDEHMGRQRLSKRRNDMETATAAAWDLFMEDVEDEEAEVLPKGACSVLVW